MHRTLLILILLGGLAAMLGCDDDPALAFKPEVVNNQDYFHFQMKDVKHHDTTMIYVWNMRGSSANIDQSAQIKGGRVTVTVEDSGYQQVVYQTDLKQNGSFTTTSGNPGWWRISIVLKDFSGMIDFLAQRR